MPEKQHQNRLPDSIRRIAVVGTTGVGKSTLADSLAHRLHLPHIELDALHWEPNWAYVSDEELRARVERATQANAWVIDGNYSSVRDIVWKRAQAIIWLDYPLTLILWRLWWRTWQRTIRRELLWGTNYERFWPQFFSKDSIFLWALQTYPRRRRQYPQLFAQPEYTHLKIIHFQSPAETAAWLESI